MIVSSDFFAPITNYTILFFPNDADSQKRMNIMVANRKEIFRMPFTAVRPSAIYSSPL